MAAANNQVVLDVRPLLRDHQDPFSLIMDTVKAMGKSDKLILHATLKPTPLLGIMKLKGFTHEVEKLEDDHWVVTFSRKGSAADANPEIETALSIEEASAHREGCIFTLDNRGLEPPQPMIRTLKQLEEMNVGDTLVIHNDRVPAFLLEELKQLNYSYEVENLSDGSALVTIRK